MKLNLSLSLCFKRALNTLLISVPTSIFAAAPYLAYEYPSPPVETVTWEFPFEVIDNDPEDTITIEVNGRPAWLNLTHTGPRTAILSGTPVLDEFGSSFSLQIRYSDDGVSFSSAWFSFYIEEFNSPPSLASITLETSENLPTTFSLADFEAAYSDLEGDPLEFIQFITLPNNGTLVDTRPQFTPEVTIAQTSMVSFGIQPADFDGDGDIDIVSAFANNDIIQWFENDGLLPPSFTAHTITAVPNGPGYVQVADLDNDGDIDFACTHLWDNTLAWYENNGTGTFTEHLVDNNMVRPDEVTINDFNGDGFDDIAILSVGDLRIYLSDAASDPTFALTQNFTSSQALFAIDSADYDNDGDIDILYSLSTSGPNTLHLLSNDGTANFTSQLIDVTPVSGFENSFATLKTADMNNDGSLDIVTYYATEIDFQTRHFLAIYYYDDATGLFTPQVIVPTQIWELSSPFNLADVDGDGDIDIIATSSDGHQGYHYFLANDGQATPSFSATSMGGASKGSRIEFADLSDDGFLDILFGASNKVFWREPVIGSTPVTTPNLEIPVSSISNYQFIPDVDFIGTASFTWNASSWDGVYAESDASITIDVINDSETKLVTTTVDSIGESWVTVELPYSYDSMVVICTPENIKTQNPVLPRIRNAGGNTFEVRAQTPNGSISSPVTMHILVVEEGIYNQAEHGLTMEAVKFESIKTDRSGSWGAESRNYANTYSNPVVLGQVMSYNDSNWSVFWARGNARGKIPNGTLKIGKHVGEDTLTSRANETIGYIVLESGSGVIDGINYSAGITSDTLQGMGNNPPYEYSIASGFVPASGVVSSAAMDGTDGGWPVLYGATPFVGGQLGVAIDEDQIKDAERNHTTEQVAFVVFD